MNTKLEEIDGKYVATLEGEMDTMAATEAEEVLKPLYHSDGKDVIIDCTDLEYIASSGLRILLVILKQTDFHLGSLRHQSLKSLMSQLHLTVL